MKPAPFAYHAPRELEEAFALLAAGAEHDTDVRILAGGQSLVPMMNFRLAVPDALVDIGRIPGLRFLRVNSAGELEVGAGIRQNELLRDPGVASRWAVLAEAVRHIGHPQIRSRGTVCGSLAHHDPTGELPALAVGLNARIQLGSARGRREVSAEEFFVSYYEVALDPGEMVVSVTFPAVHPAAGWGFRELGRRRGDFALVGAVCVLPPGDSSDGAAPRVVVFGAGGRPVRVAAAEELAARADGDLDADRIRLHVADTVDPISDIHATAEYRRAVAAELTVQAVLAAVEGRS